MINVWLDGEVKIVKIYGGLCVKSVLNIIGVNSLRLGGLHKY